MLNIGEYTGYIDTHTGHIVCIYYLLDNLHLSFNKHCNMFVMTFVENEQNECITFCDATPFFLRLNNYCCLIVASNIIIFK